MKTIGAYRETREFVLRNQYGMNIRTAGLFAKVVSRFDANVWVEANGNMVSGKNILALVSLEAACGSRLRVVALGPQAKKALDELQASIARKFGCLDE